MVKCKICKKDIPDGEEYCKDCLDKKTNMSNESYLDSLLSSVKNTATPPDNKIKKDGGKKSKKLVKEKSSLKEIDPFDMNDDVIEFDQDEYMKDLQNGNLISINDEDLYGSDLFNENAGTDSTGDKTLTEQPDNSIELHNGNASIGSVNLEDMKSQEKPDAGNNREKSATQGKTDENKDNDKSGKVIEPGEYLEDQEGTNTEHDIDELLRDNNANIDSEFMKDKVLQEENQNDADQNDEDDEFDPSLGDLLNGLDVSPNKVKPAEGVGKENNRIKSSDISGRVDSKEKTADGNISKDSAMAEPENGENEKDALVEDDLLSLLNQLNPEDPITKDIKAISNMVNGKTDSEQDQVNGKTDSEQKQVNGKTDSGQDQVNGKTDNEQKQVNGKTDIEQKQQNKNLPGDVGEVFSDALTAVSSLKDEKADELPEKIEPAESKADKKEKKKQKKELVKKLREQKKEQKLKKKKEEKAKREEQKKNKKSKKDIKDNKKENENKDTKLDIADGGNSSVKKASSASGKGNGKADLSAKNPDIKKKPEEDESTTDKNIASDEKKLFGKKKKKTTESNKEKEKSNKKEKTGEEKSKDKTEDKKGNKEDEAKKGKKNKKNKKKDNIEAIDDLEEEIGHINKLGATIVFLFFGIIVILLLVGTNIFSYTLSIKNAKTYFYSQKYTQAYDEVYGIDIKDEDYATYNKIMTVMYVNKQLNSYNNYHAMKKYPEALDSLLKGLNRYDKYVELATMLGVKQDLDYVRNQIIAELNNVFNISEKKAMKILKSKTQAEYSNNVYDAVLENSNLQN